MSDENKLEGPPVTITYHDDGSMSATLTNVGRGIIGYIEQEFKKGRDIEDIAKELNSDVDGLRVLLALATLSGV